MAAAATCLSPALASSSSSSSSLSTSSISRKHCSLSISIISLPQQQHTKWNHQLGISKFSTWNGLRHHLGIPTSQYLVKLGRKGKCKGKGVYASLFGVGAPEALVIGVVALLVFGPKGLAEVARNVGKTLRTFQPTIRELQDVSREFKSTLEREIGLDEIKELTRPTPVRPPTAVSEDPQKAVDPTEESPSSRKPYTTEEYLKVTQEQLKKQKEMESSSESQVEPEGLSQDSSPSSSEASLTEDYATTSKQQLEALADLQQKDASTESLVEPEGQKQDGSLAAKDAETQEYLKKLEEEVKAVIAEKQRKAASAATEIKSQDAQEAASVTPPSPKPESET